MNKESPASFEVQSKQVVSVKHVLLFGKFNMVVNILQNLGHQYQSMFYVVWWLKIQNKHFLRGY